MKITRILPITALALALAGCAAVDTPTRNMPLDVPGLSGEVAPVARSYRVQDVQVTVPATLRASEGNSYYPFTDIVWRGDPVGDRHAQIATLFTEAAARGTASLQGAVPVVAEITVRRFHGVTERTRYSVGGVYNMPFELTVRHAETGAILEGPRLVEANLPAPGGLAAVQLEQAGQTERVRVTDFLTFVIGRELGVAGAV